MRCKGPSGEIFRERMVVWCAVGSEQPHFSASRDFHPAVGCSIS